MKLLFCYNCHDLFLLTHETRECKCKKTKGRYIDDLNAEYSGLNAVPCGIDNHSFAKSVKEYRTFNNAINFNAFVISKTCRTFKEVEDEN